MRSGLGGLVECFGLFATGVGGAEADRCGGEEYLTLSAVRAAKAARVLGAREVIPIDFDGWGHFSEGAAELRAAFQRAGLDELLRIPAPGHRIVVEPARSLHLAIVGVSGTVGRAIVSEALARGHEVTTISRHPSPRQPATD